MECPLINILIRTSNRPNEFKRCLKSIVSQSYPNIRIIIGYDNPKALEYIPEPLEKVFVSADRSLPYWYDNYCNDLKSLVTDGWFCWVDDDDILNPDILKDIVLDAPVVLVQLQRQNNIVPKGVDFTRGNVGMPCVLVHHSLKEIAHVQSTGAGDFFYIKDLKEKVGLKFQPIIMVYSFGRGLGRVG